MVSNLTQVVVSFGLIGTGIVKILLEEDLGIVEFTNLVKINSILVALCVDYKRCAC